MGILLSLSAPNKSNPQFSMQNIWQNEFLAFYKYIGQQFSFRTSDNVFPITTILVELVPSEFDLINEIKEVDLTDKEVLINCPHC